MAATDEPAPAQEDKPDFPTERLGAGEWPDTASDSPATGSVDQVGDERFGAVLCRHWAIVPEALPDFVRPGASRGDAMISARHAEQHVSGEEAETARLAAAGGSSAAMRSPTGSGGVIAVLPLRGTIRPRGSWLSQLFGGGGLQDFRESFREALADGNVEAIVIDIDSPGGLIDLVPETSAEIRAARGVKPIVAVANTMAASAAYWIASQADELVVTPSGQVGSIGVFVIHEDYSAMEKMMGIETTIISAGPYKTDGNPYEPLSKSAEAAMQDQVDQLYSMFTADVAAGRGVKQEAVAAGYGSGRLLLSADALAVGMVDRIETLEDTLARLGGTPEEDDDTDAQAPEDDADDEGDEALDDPEDKMSAATPSAAATPATDEQNTTVTFARPTKDYLSPQSALREQSYL